MNLNSMTVAQLIEEASTANRKAMGVFLNFCLPYDAYTDANKESVGIEREILKRFEELKKELEAKEEVGEYGRLNNGKVKYKGENQ